MQNLLLYVLLHLAGVAVTVVLWWRPLRRMARVGMTDRELMFRSITGSFVAWPLLLLFFFIARAKRRTQ